MGFSGNGFHAHGLCRAAIGPCHGESQECHEGLDVGRVVQVSVLAIEAARLGIGKEAYDCPSSPVGSQRVFGIGGVGQHDQPFAVLEPLGGEAQG
jgi:hypothetical protein